MDELRALIHPYAAILQLQCGIAHLPYLDPGNVEVERLSLDMQTVLRDSAAPLHELGIVFG